MITAATIFLSIVIFASFIKMQANFRKSTQQHVAKVKSLQKMLVNLQETQNHLCEKVQLLDSFNKDYKKSAFRISSEIVALQYELFKYVS